MIGIGVGVKVSMSNLVPAGRTGAIAIYEGSDNPWADIGLSVESGAFLNFNGNTGEITFGSESNSLGDNSSVVADLMGMAVGWICWKNSEPVEEVLVPVTQGKPPLEHELKDHGPYGDGWREAISLPMIVESVAGDPNHEFVGTKLLFKTSTGGAVRSTKKLSGAFGKLFREHLGEMPIVEISTESYTPRDKKFGKKYAINFKIVDWIDEVGLAEIVGELNDEGGDYLPENDSGAAIEGKFKEVQKAPEPEPEPEVVEEEPAAPPMRQARTPRGGAAAPVAETPAQAPTGRRTAAPPAEPAMEAAPTERGRSDERGGRRTRRFAA
jgi:hypothetical protein